MLLRHCLGSTVDGGLEYPWKVRHNKTGASRILLGFIKYQSFLNLVRFAHSKCLASLCIILVSPLRIVYIPHSFGSSLWSQSDQQLANALRKCEVLEFKKGVPWLTTWRLLVFKVFLALLGTVHQPSLPFARLGVWSRSKMKKRKCWCQWLNPKPATWSSLNISQGGEVAGSQAESVWNSSASKISGRHSRK